MTEKAPGSDAARRASARARIADAARQMAEDGSTPAPPAGPASPPRPTRARRPIASGAAGSTGPPRPPPPAPAPERPEPGAPGPELPTPTWRPPPPPTGPPPHPPPTGVAGTYGWTPPAKKSKADAALTLGIVSLFLNLFYVPGILAIIWGGRERRESTRARAGFVCGIVGTALWALVTVVVVILAFTAGNAFSSRLLRADFRTGSRPFSTGVTPEVNYDLVDGTYRIQSRTSESGLVSSVAYFARTAYVVDMSAQVVSASGNSVFGVGCLSSEHDGYYLLAATGGGVALGRKDEESDSNDRTRLIAANEGAAVPANDVELRLSCSNSLVGSSVTLTGYVNGREVIQGTDSQGRDGFRMGALVFDSSTSGAEVRFSRADAVVTGTD
jgi:hypothetical protein